MGRFPARNGKAYDISSAMQLTQLQTGRIFVIFLIFYIYRRDLVVSIGRWFFFLLFHFIAYVSCWRVETHRLAVSQLCDPTTIGYKLHFHRPMNYENGFQ